jgi:hypothetical protein
MAIFSGNRRKVTLGLPLPGGEPVMIWGLGYICVVRRITGVL